jgi:hypothetical protein
MICPPFCRDFSHIYRAPMLAEIEAAEAVEKQVDGEETLQAIDDELKQ